MMIRASCMGRQSHVLERYRESKDEEAVIDQVRFCASSELSSRNSKSALHSSIFAAPDWTPTSGMNQFSAVIPRQC